MQNDSKTSALPQSRGIGGGGAFAGRIFSIAVNTFHETVRDRVLYNLVVFVLLMTAAAILLGELTAGQESRVIVDLGLALVLIFGAFIAIFVGIGLVAKEIEKRTIYVILAKPVRRWEFVVGKYFGLCFMLLLNVVIMTCGLYAALFAVGGADAYMPSVIGAVILIYFELMVITAVAVLFSSYSSPALSMFFTFVIFILGHFSTALKEFADSMGMWGAREILTVFYYVLPNLSYFSFAGPAAAGHIPEAGLVVSALLYAAAYIVTMLSVACAVFGRRNFK